ncbi:MAG: hypothetical protein KAU58_04915 [Candidatus Omnitrophica bacterium]|nr:hypothetical protein [Candidatus Omnitrophota bacterium]
MRKRILLLILGVFSVIVVIFFILSSFGYKYSDEQSTIIKELGRPDSFVLVFSTDEEGNNERLETWNYHDCEFSVTFLNGIFSGADEIEPLPENAIPARHEPEQFESHMGWKDILDEIGHKPWMRASDTLPDLFSETDLELYYSEQIVAGFDTKTNDLVYVKTMVLVPEESRE